MLRIRTDEQAKQAPHPSLHLTNTYQNRKEQMGRQHTNAMCHLYGDRKMKSRCPSRDKCNDRCECVYVSVCERASVSMCPLGGDSGTSTCHAVDVSDDNTYREAH